MKHLLVTYMKHLQIMCPLLAKGPSPQRSPPPFAHAHAGTLPEDWRVVDPRDSRGGDASGIRGNALPVAGAREVRWQQQSALLNLLFCAGYSIRGSGIKHPLPRLLWSCWVAAIGPKKRRLMTIMAARCCIYRCVIMQVVNCW